MSEPISANELLARMRALSAQLEKGGGESVSATGRSDFSAVLQRSINQVNEVQQQAKGTAQAYEVGDPNVSVADVMIAAQKSSIAFQAATQVRNKLVAAYQEVMSMQI